MLDWTTYDQVRRGQREPKGLAGFSEASRSVQAVLGAGDSRTSALGLAVLPMQIWRLAHGLEPARPHLVQPQPDTDLTLPAGLDLQSAAQVVLTGMRKAVEPAEAGWQGAGTVAPAFARELGRPCLGACGIWAKTGTVSQQDRGFRGTTVLSALVDTAELARWSGQALPPGSQERILSIGIIAQPQGSAIKTHAASHLGMGLLRHLTLQASPP